MQTNERHIATALLASLFVIFSVHLSLAADQVTMKNGDRLTGQIIRMEEELLYFRADYSNDKLILEWKQVGCIETEGERTAVFSDNELLIGRISCPSPGRLQITSARVGATREIEPSELKAVDPGTYRGYFNFGGSMARGNTDTAAANLATRFEVKTPRHRLTVEGKLNYAASDGSDTARNSLGSLKYDLFKREKMYSYAQFLTERDDFANLNLRLTQGLGMGYQFDDRRKLRFHTEAGISYYNEDVKAGDDKSGASGRWAVGLEWEAASKRLQLYHRQEGYYTPAESSVYIRTEQGVRAPVHDQFGGFLEVDYRFNSNPDAGKGHHDVFITLGISYEYAYW